MAVSGPVLLLLLFLLLLPPFCSWGRPGLLFFSSVCVAARTALVVEGRSGTAHAMSLVSSLFSFLSARPAPLSFSLVLSFSFCLSFLSFFSLSCMHQWRCWVTELKGSIPEREPDTLPHVKGRQQARKIPNPDSPTGFTQGVAPRIAVVVLLQSWDAIP